ncbi:MAG: nucleoside diphosphate kinase regulator [Kiritimatiellae bacterium]|nr:nucleoside diphosphate kinase regulator [Kiritimatiellia bacterium]
MNERSILITKQDKERLEEILDVAAEFGERARKDLDALRDELLRAEIVEPQAIHRGVVTMNSKVLLEDLDNRERMTVTLVFPADANADEGAVSVLAPVGTAILGYSEGDVVEWPVPDGVRRLKIRKVVYQPEAAGDFHL